MSLALVGTHEERRGFHFFHEHTWPQLSAELHSDFLNPLVFQASHVDTALRHAVTAFGALGERLQIHEVISHPENEHANKLHDFAISQYYKAIGELRKQLCSGNQHSVELTLMTCFMFICIEFLQGNENGALTHLKSGLEILRRPQNSYLTAAQNRLSLTSSNPEGFDVHLVDLYTTLKRTAATWIGESLHGVVTTLTESLDFGSLIWEGFSTVAEAQKYLSKLLVQLRCNVVIIHNQPTRPADEEFQVGVPLHDQFFESLRNWALAMDAYLAQSRQAISCDHVHQATILQIQHTVATLMLSASCELSEEGFYSNCDLSFDYIVSLVTSLIRPVNVMLDSRLFPTSRQLFVFNAGTIQPLYFTAIKCCNPKIQRKALSLLSTSPWREGAWDSAAMASIAERKIKQRTEQEFSPCDTLRFHSP